MPERFRSEFLTMGRNTNISLHFTFLQEILKYTERAGLDATDLKKAVEVMRVVPKAANDMMNVGRLQGFEVRSFLSFVDVVCLLYLYELHIVCHGTVWNSRPGCL